MSPMTEGRKLLLRGLLEADFREQVRSWAEARDWLVYFTWNSRHSPSGFPDLVMARSPRLVIAELKTQGAPPPKGRQLLWLEILARVPCLEVFVWRPWDEDHILQVLA